MNEIFLIFLSLSLSGSLIALLLYLLKPVIKNRLSKTWQYYIFLIVIVRLLLPFGPESSLMGLIFNQTEGYVATENNTDSMDHTLLTVPDDAPRIQPNENVVAPPSTAKNIGQMVMNWLWLAWLIPTIVLLIRKIVGYVRFTQSVKSGCQGHLKPHTLHVYQKTCEAMGIRRCPGLRKNEHIASPMLIGGVRPVIVLPDTDLNDTEIQYIFQHELTHYRRLDIVYKWLVQIAVCVHWYNPIVYWVSREINRNCELSCDETVIKRLDDKSKYAYGDLLLETIKRNKTIPRQVVTITLSEDTKLMKERLGAIMKYRKKTRTVVLLSVLLGVFLLCGATYAGAYAVTKPHLPTSDHTSIVSPIVIDTKTLASGSKISLGSQQLLADTSCRIALAWNGNGDDTLSILCTSSNGATKSYTIENGKTFTFKIEDDGEYTIAVKNNNANGIKNIKGSISFQQDSPVQQSPDTAIPAQTNATNVQTVIYENVEMRRYEGEDGHPYIHNVKSNHTNKAIAEYKRGMLAFDENGQPLQIDWWSLDTSLEPEYFCLYHDETVDLSVGETDDVFGGWSLNLMGIDQAVDKIAYVLYCDKEITFEDGTVWKNPNFEEWLKTYEGKTMDVQVLENYYPCEQKIAF